MNVVCGNSTRKDQTRHAKRFGFEAPTLIHRSENPAQFFKRRINGKFRDRAHCREGTHYAVSIVSFSRLLMATEMPQALFGEAECLDVESVELPRYRYYVLCTKEHLNCRYYISEILWIRKRSRPCPY